jgi:hypothetical protein
MKYKDYHKQKKMSTWLVFRHQGQQAYKKEWGGYLKESPNNFGMLL